MSAAGGPRALPTAATGAGNVKAVRAQLELAEQDCARVSAPDYATPFSSLEDAVDRLLPFHVFGAEDPQHADLREVEAQSAAAQLATTRHEAWQDFVMQKVNEYGVGLTLVEKHIHKAEQEALQRSQLPLLMLQSYATAEAQALMVSEQQRPQLVAAEREAAQRQAQAAALAEEQRKQHQMMMAQQMQLQMQLQQQQQQQQRLAQQKQQQAAAAAAAAAQQQQQQQAQAQAAHRSLLQQPQGLQLGAAPPQGRPLGVGMQPGQQPMRPAGPPMQQHQQQQQPSAKGLSAADLKAKQLAALAARVSQRK